MGEFFNKSFVVLLGIVAIIAIVVLMAWAYLWLSRTFGLPSFLERDPFAPEVKENTLDGDDQKYAEALEADELALARSRYQTAKKKKRRPIFRE